MDAYRKADSGEGKAEETPPSQARYNGVCKQVVIDTSQMSADDIARLLTFAAGLIPPNYQCPRCLCDNYVMFRQISTPGVTVFCTGCNQRFIL